MNICYDNVPTGTLDFGSAPQRLGFLISQTVCIDRKNFLSINIYTIAIRAWFFVFFFFFLTAIASMMCILINIVDVERRVKTKNKNVDMTTIRLWPCSMCKCTKKKNLRFHNTLYLFNILASTAGGSRFQSIKNNVHAYSAQQHSQTQHTSAYVFAVIYNYVLNTIISRSFRQPMT